MGQDAFEDVQTQHSMPARDKAGPSPGSLLNSDGSIPVHGVGQALPEKHWTRLSDTVSLLTA